MRVAAAPLIAPYRLLPLRFRNFKQPRFCILAARCVRGLPVPREPCEGVERREAPGHQRAPLEAGLTYPPRAARLPRAPSDVGRSASRRSTLATSLSPDAADARRAVIYNPRLVYLSTGKTSSGGALHSTASFQAETPRKLYSAAALCGRPTNPASSPKRSTITAGRSLLLWVTQAPERTV